MAALLNAIVCYFISGTRLLCPACGVALGCLWAPNALLLCFTVLQPCALQRLEKKKKTGVSILYGGVIFSGIGTYRISSEKQYTSSPINFG